jgi:hypothetical protein
MDFEKIAHSTQAAIEKEKLLKPEDPTTFNLIAATPSNAPRAMEPRAHRSAKIGETRSPKNRIILVDVLKDCVATGNWAKAVHLFQEAVEKSVSGVRHGASSVRSAEDMRELEEKDIAKILTTQSSSNVGIGRWNGNHFYSLFRALLGAEAVEPLQKVWRLVRVAGIPEMRFDTFTVNGMIHLMRQENLRVARMSTAPRKLTAEALRDMKNFRARFAADLAELAAAKQLNLNEASLKIVKELQKRQSGDSDVAAMDTNTRSIRIDDLNVLLENASSLEMVSRALRLIEKSGVTPDGNTFAAVVRQLRRLSPKGVGAKDKEPTSQPSAPLTLNGSHADNSPSVTEDYVADRVHIQKRCSEIFSECCSKGIVNTNLCNELLLVFRPKPCSAQFDRVLRFMVKGPAQDPNAPEGSSAHSARELCVDLKQLSATTATWHVPPDSKTFEILITRAVRYQQYQRCWEYYEHQQVMRIRGTKGLYQSMITAASIAPPQSPRTHHGSAILEIYTHMKEAGFDVNDAESTIGLINAWSNDKAVRRRLR